MPDNGKFPFTDIIKIVGDDLNAPIAIHNLVEYDEWGLIFSRLVVLYSY